MRAATMKVRPPQPCKEGHVAKNGLLAGIYAGEVAYWG